LGGEPGYRTVVCIQYVLEPVTVVVEVGEEAVNIEMGGIREAVIR
jgi:hypothetical protein